MGAGKNGKDGLKAPRLLLGAGGFGLIVLYLAGVTGPRRRHVADRARLAAAEPVRKIRNDGPGNRRSTGSRRFAAVTLSCDEGAMASGSNCPAAERSAASAPASRSDAAAWDLRAMLSFLTLRK